MTNLSATQLDELEAWLVKTDSFTKPSDILYAVFSDLKDTEPVCLRASTLRALLELAHRAHFLAEAYNALNSGEYIPIKEHRTREQALANAVDQIIEVAP